MLLNTNTDYTEVSARRHFSFNDMSFCRKIWKCSLRKVWSQPRTSKHLQKVQHALAVPRKIPPRLWLPPCNSWWQWLTNARNISEWACKEINLLKSHVEKWRNRNIYYSPILSLSVFAECPGLIAQENTALSFTTDAMNQRQQKVEHFIFWLYQYTLAYSSLLNGDKILVLLQDEYVAGCLATHGAIGNCAKWTRNKILLIRSTVDPFCVAINNYIACKVSLAWPLLGWKGIKCNRVLIKELYQDNGSIL